MSPYGVTRLCIGRRIIGEIKHCLPLIFRAPRASMNLSRQFIVVRFLSTPKRRRSFIFRGHPKTNPKPLLYLQAEFDGIFPQQADDG